MLLGLQPARNDAYMVTTIYIEGASGIQKAGDEINSKERRKIPSL
jgi:hypothetical protein